MLKKILCLTLALVMVMGMAVVAVSAAQIEIANGSADAASTGAGNTFTFDVASAGWKNYKNIFCHIWPIDGGDSLASWQAKAERCTDNGDGTFTYNLDEKGFTLDSSIQYGIIFSADTGKQTYNLIAGTACFGDTAYCDGTEYENPEDSKQKAQAAFWKNHSASEYGPELKISSIGTVVGTCCPKNSTPQSMFVSFLKNTLENARTFSGKDDQTLLDDTAAALGISSDDVAAAITESGVSGISWTNPNGGSGSTTPSTDGTKTTDPTTANDGSNNSGNGNNNSNNTNTTGNNTTTGTTKTTGNTGTATGTTTTGQETTVLFVMLGVMVAAAGVIFFIRKKDRA